MPGTAATVLPGLCFLLQIWEMYVVLYIADAKEKEQSMASVGELLYIRSVAPLPRCSVLLVSAFLMGIGPFAQRKMARREQEICFPKFTKMSTIMWTLGVG